MLVNCPKCGFSQPKDRYCASCGVDMELYRPKQTPALKKLLGSPLLHVALIFVVVLTTLLFLRQTRQEELRSRVELLKGGPVLIEKQDRNKVEVSASQQAQAELARENTPPPPSTEMTTPTEAANVTVTTLPATTAAAANKSLEAGARIGENKNVPNRAVIFYAEVDRTVLEAWTEEMRRVGQVRTFDDILMGVLPQGAQKIKGARGVKILQQLEQPLQGSTHNYEWFVGTHKTPEVENEMGFFSSMTLSDIKEGLVKGELEVQRAFRYPKDPNKTMERVSYGGPFELPPGGAFLIRGLLPPKFVTDLPMDNNSDPFLSIFNSRSFANGQTEFTLILEFDTSGPVGR